MKVLGLDLGDRWVGVAISDALKISCKPCETVQLEQLEPFLTQLFTKETITTVVVGYPKTFMGGESAQTNKIVELKNALQERFSSVGGRSLQWLLWDERLSSKRASELQQRASSPDAKRKSHAIAAAFILQSYLDNLAFHTVES